MDTITGFIANCWGQETVAISKASLPQERFAFVMNRIVEEAQRISGTYAPLEKGKVAGLLLCVVKENTHLK